MVVIGNAGKRGRGHDTLVCEREGERVSEWEEKEWVSERECVWVSECVRETNFMYHDRYAVKPKSKDNRYIRVWTRELYRRNFIFIFSLQICCSFTKRKSTRFCVALQLLQRSFYSSRKWIKSKIWKHRKNRLITSVKRSKLCHVFMYFYPIVFVENRFVKYAKFDCWF